MPIFWLELCPRKSGENVVDPIDNRSEISIPHGTDNGGKLMILSVIIYCCSIRVWNFGTTSPQSIVKAWKMFLLLDFSFDPRLYPVVHVPFKGKKISSKWSGALFVWGKWSTLWSLSRFLKSLSSGITRLLFSSIKVSSDCCKLVTMELTVCYHINVLGHLALHSANESCSQMYEMRALLFHSLLPFFQLWNERTLMELRRWGKCLEKSGNLRDPSVIPVGSTYAWDIAGMDEISALS